MSKKKLLLYPLTIDITQSAQVPNIVYPHFSNQVLYVTKYMYKVRKVQINYILKIFKPWPKAKTWSRKEFQSLTKNI